MIPFVVVCHSCGVYHHLGQHKTDDTCLGKSHDDKIGQKAVAAFIWKHLECNPDLLIVPLDNVVSDDEYTNAEKEVRFL